MSGVSVIASRGNDDEAFPYSQEAFQYPQMDIGAMLTCLLFPAMVFGIATLLEGHMVQSGQGGQGAQQRAATDALLLDAATHADNWQDPQWRRAFADRLATVKSGILIQDASGNDIIRENLHGYGSRGGPWQGSGQRVVVVEGGRTVGIVTLFAPWSASAAVRLTATIGFVLAFGCVFWQLGRFIVRPLEGLGRAARRIAGGGLHFTLPRSPVREVAAVCEAFDAMGAGLRDAVGRQAALEEERRFFVGAIAHDLRTPLFVLRGYLVALKQGLATSPEKAARYIVFARQRADHLDRLVSDLFTYTQGEYLEQTLHRERLDLGPLLARVMDAFMPRAGGEGITITITITITNDTPDASCAIAGDAHLLERVIENLLDNALRYAPCGGRNRGAVAHEGRPGGIHGHGHRAGYRPA